MRLRPALATAGLIALMSGLWAPAAAQVVPDGALRPDAGASRLPPPVYADPVPRPAPGPSKTPTAPSVTRVPGDVPGVPDQGAVTLTQLIVEGDRAMKPVEAWAPARDAASGLVVSLEPDELIDPAWVQRQFAANDLVGPPVPYARIIALIQLINAQFAVNGYVNSGLLVPSQPPIRESGPLRLRLVLGRVAADGLNIADPGRGLDRRFVLDRLPSATAYPFNAADFERQFRLLAEDPAVTTVNADLRPHGRPGEAALAVTVMPAERLDAYISLANSRTPSIGAQRTAIGGSIRNLLTPGDRLAIEFGRTRGVIDVAASFEEPIFSPSWQFFVGLGFNDAAVVDSILAPLDIRTEGIQLYTGLAHQLIKTPLMPKGDGTFAPSTSLVARAQFDFRDTKTFLLGERFSFAPGSVDGVSRYYAARLALDFVSRSIRQVLALSVSLSVGIDGTRSDIAGVPAPDRNFIGVLGQANYARRLNGAGTELRGRLTAQYSSSVTYAGERLPIGGLNSVRGYRETLYLVDNAVIGSIELSQPLNLGGGADVTGPGQFVIGAFVDAAWFRNREPPNPPRDFISGAGLSLAWTPHPALSARVTWAHDFQKTRVAGNRNLQDDGVYFSILFNPSRLQR